MDESGNKFDAFLMFSAIRLSLAMFDVMSSSLKKIYSTTAGAIVMTSGLFLLTEWFVADPLGERDGGDRMQRTLDFGLFATIPMLFTVCAGILAPDDFAGAV